VPSGYQLLAGAYHLEPGALYVPVIYMVPAFLISVFSAYRLAKFNVDERQHDGFIGLATPAMALFAAALPLIVFTDAYNLAPVILNKWLLYACIVLFSWIMVAEIPMFSLKTKSFSWKGNELRFIFLLLCILMIIFLKYTGIATAIILYIVICLVEHYFSGKSKTENQTNPNL
jgi:CDP-diacylglycerol--serine O-phosphatidyltransferase